MRSLGKGWRITRHADDRRLEMGLSTDDIRYVLERPDVEYDGAANHPPGRRVRRREGTCVVFEPHDRIVVTLLWDGALGRDPTGQPMSWAS